MAEDPVLADRGRGSWLGRPFRHFIVWFRFGLGSAAREKGGLPRLSADRAHELISPHVQVGDVVLTGSGGKVSHVMIYIGAGDVIHAMATQKTQRRFITRVLDIFTAPFAIVGRFIFRMKPKKGVIKEEMVGFFDRFYRDSFVIMRHPSITDDEIPAGVERLRSIIGAPYDWDFAPDNDRYYCTELVWEFFNAAMGDRAPRLTVHKKDFPLLLHREAVIEADDVLGCRDLDIMHALPEALLSRDEEE